MEIIRALVVLALAGSFGLAQVGSMGGLRDPRIAGGMQPGESVIHPWLAVSGAYNTPVDTSPDLHAEIYRTIGVSGGLSMIKPFRRSTLVLGYAGSGYRNFGNNQYQSDWLYSNVVSLAVGTQISRRLTLNIGELAGASNGGYGYTAWATTGSSNGVIGSIGVAGGALNGGSVLPPGASTSNPLQNNMVDTAATSTMTYFSDTSASMGVLLSQRTMLSFGGSAYFARRPDYHFSDTNGYTGNVGVSTYWSQRLLTFANYSYSRFDYVNSIGYSNINGFSVGAQYQLSPHDSLSGSFGMSFLDSHFLASLLLPPDIAKILGVPQIFYIANVNEHFITGTAAYSHSFQRGGFGVNCGSGVTPGSDLLLLSRREWCGTSLNGTITQRLSVSALGGVSRQDGLAQSGTRYDVFDVGLTFAYRFLRGLSFTAGATYYKNYVKPSTYSYSYVGANAGLYWTPEHGLKLF